MENFSRDRFERLVKGARVLATTRNGPSVYLTADNHAVKMFRQKGLMSSNRLWPYARRFVRNAARLNALGFDSVAVKMAAKCRDLGAYFVVYPLLPGRTIRELKGGDEQRRALAKLPGYLCALHRKGVYYKALHLGQVLWRDDGSFALLDVASTRFRARPISARKRARNFFNILRYAEDHASLTRYGLTRFFGDYLACCELNEKGRARLLRKLRNARSFPELEQALGDL